MDSESQEPEDLGDDEGFPVDLVELHEIIAWEEAVADATEDR